MNKKLVIISSIGAGVLAIAAAGGYCLPYLTLKNMKTAAANRDAEALARQINFPELRTSVKENVKTQMLKQIADSGAKTTPEMGQELATKMIGPMVDKMVTPEGLDQLMQANVPGTIKLADIEKNIEASEIKMGYESIDRFVVHITDKVDRAKDVVLILKRDGLAWKLSGIDISKV